VRRKTEAPKREQSVGRGLADSRAPRDDRLDELDGLSQPLARDALLEFLGEQPVVLSDYDVNWDVRPGIELAGFGEDAFSF
jgi:hypothetical protein